jgi:tetratricopeptide (TPR) repeat protein
VKVKEAAKNAWELIGAGLHDTAMSVLSLASRHVQSRADWIALDDTWRGVGDRWLGAPNSTLARLRALRGARDPKRLLLEAQRALETRDRPEVRVELASAYLALEHSDRARALLEPYEFSNDLEPTTLGVALRLLGLARGDTDLLTRAAQRLTGRELALTLAARALMHLERDASREARHDLVAALELLPKDPYYRAWLTHALGITYVRENSPLGEAHFLDAERWARHRDARELTSRALAGLGTSRRLRLEYDRALHAYERALERAGPDKDDAINARWGIAQSQRLLGRHPEALLTLGTATEPRLATLQALTLLELRDPDAARDALRHADKVQGAHVQRLALARAELARLSGDLNAARNHLERVEPRGLIATEDASRFTELAHLWAAFGHAAPTPPRQITHRVRVTTRPALGVTVNDRDIPLNSTGRTAELLAFLVTRDGAASTAQIAEALYPHATRDEHRTNTKRISDLRTALEDALGWTDSVKNIGGALRLDPRASWEAVTGRGRFLSGIDSEWAVEHDRRVN